MKHRTAVLFAVFFLCSAAGGFLSAQTVSAGLYPTGEYRSAEESFAALEFRRGVQAFYRGSFNEAILQFEKSLSYLPEDNLILDWLGKAYYHSGLEGTAIQEWSKASQSGYGGLLLLNKIEVVKERRVAVSEDEMEIRYSESGSFPGVFNGEMIFSAPVSVLPNSNGTAWVLAYGSNELLRLDVNGVVIDRVTGPLNGFDRPVDIIRLANSNMLVSESAGDRLALLNGNGRFIRYFGEKGRSAGQMVSPLYLAQDSRSNIFVTDYGNMRVDVFDSDGNGLFFFGQESAGFEGLRGPTGIAVINDIVYVADNVKGCIYEFDLAGNFRRALVEENTFRHPESMKVWQDYLVVCDSNKVFSVDVNTGAVYENMNTGNAPSRLTSAVPDINGNVLVTDIQANEVYVMSKMQELVGGLFVQIEKVSAEKFPEVTLEVKVENRHRNPVVGLKETNFYFTEDKRPVSKLKFNGSSYENTYADITLLIDRSVHSRKFTEDGGIETVVRSIAKSMQGKGTLRVVCAGKIPAVEYAGSPEGALQFSAEGLRTPYSSSVPMDLAIRLCANDLINAAKKRAVIIIGAGKTTLNAFDKYNLSETTAYLSNNSIPCLYVKGFDNSDLDENLDYLIRTTFGSEYFVWQAEGLDGIVQDILDIPSGTYSFTYTSALSTNFGEKYLPVEVETYLMNRSGRDETGYFAPLK